MSKNPSLMSALQAFERSPGTTPSQAAVTSSQQPEERRGSAMQSPSRREKGSHWIL